MENNLSNFGKTGNIDLDRIKEDLEELMNWIIQQKKESIVETQMLEEDEEIEERNDTSEMGEVKFAIEGNSLIGILQKSNSK